MALLPLFRRLNKEDIPNAPNWISDIINPLNTFQEQTLALLNGQLSIGQNVQGQKFTSSFTTPSTYATGAFTPIKFLYIGGGQPSCLMIGQITRTDGTAITTPVSITGWTLNINTSPYQAYITYIAGLSASTQYSGTFILL